MKNFYCFFVVLFVISCSQEEYPYRKDLDSFLSTLFNYEITKEETIMVFLPMDGCSTCLESTIELLVDNREATLNLIVSSSDDNVFEQFELGKLRTKANKFYFDRENDYQRYEIGVIAPIILHFKNGKCIFYSETTENNHEKIKKYFDWS
jgi:hypothetical protein